MNLGDDSRHELRGILAAWEVPAAVVGRDYRILVANSAYLRAFGSEVEGKRCHQATHGYDRPCHEVGEICPIETCSQTGEPTESVHLHHTSRGVQRVALKVWPLRDASGTISGHLELVRTLIPGSALQSPDRIVGRSPAFQRMMSLVAKVAPSQTSVLLRGESGTGKELVARAVHALSPRARATFVPVDCSGLAESLFESELFGHEKGSFTNATSRKQGLVEAAEGGTLFIAAARSACRPSSSAKPCSGATTGYRCCAII